MNCAKRIWQISSSSITEMTDRPNDSIEDLDPDAQKQMGLLREFFHFLGHNKKYWMAPIIIVLLLLGILVIVGGSSSAPFIYTLF